MDELPVLNRLCKDLYESVDPQVRHQAELNLAELSESPECLQRCMLLLARGDYPYGPMVASTTLMKLLGGKTSITSSQKLELAKYLLEMLGQGAPQFPAYLVTSLCQLFARLTKQEWTYLIVQENSAEDSKNEYPFREPVDSLIKTVNMDNLEESMLAVQLLTLLVADMNSASGMDSVNQHRKNLSQFRDDFLYEIFSVSLNLLSNNVDKNLNDRQITLMHAVLNLNLQCLLFDYIGSLTDETSEDNCNVQIPTAWRASFTDGKIVQLMFKLLEKLPQESSEKVMTIIAQLASIRRTLFNGTERQAYVQKLVEGVVSVIMNPEKLSDQAAFHEFCRLIARLKTNYQLCELIAVPCYSHMLRLLAEFTVQSLRMMEFSANSTYFLMTFWQRMVTSVPYVRNNDEHLLNIYCPEIMTSFVESRLQHVESIVREGAENPLDDQGSTLQIMEHLSIICRCEYEKTCKLLTQHFDQNANIWMNGSDNKIITGLCRDLRGVAIASTTKAIFQILFEWMYPDVFTIMQFSVEKWPGCADVVTPILRLLSEMVQNRQQRLKFEMSSCSAVLLFKETSKIVSIYGERLLQLPDVSKDRVYKERYKNIGVIFLILKNALIGAYVPFGVFRLYGDSCLQDALTTFVKLFMSIPPDDFHSYTKIAQNHYNLLEHVVQDNMPFVTNLSVDVFCALLRSIHSGMSSADAIVITSACSSLDTILNYLYRRLTRSTPPTNKVGMDPEGDNILIAVKQHPEILAKMLQAVITLMMFGEVKCQWSLSRPLLGLILIQEDVYTNMKRELTSQQTYDRQADFDMLFTQLMSNVEMNVSVKNKDTFTQNLTRFRRDIAGVLKGQSMQSTNPVNQDMQHQD
uniref:Exportin-7/Ran-binding protein 17 TPR repeats domain-containing protein n=1 Tax=Caenorhabditis japonica TaxID=281687 RepID=A0A8R1HPD2_CAEJA